MRSIFPLEDWHTQEGSPLTGGQITSALIEHTVSTSTDRRNASLGSILQLDAKNNFMLKIDTAHARD